MFFFTNFLLSFIYLFCRRERTSVRSREKKSCSASSASPSLAGRVGLSKRSSKSEKKGGRGRPSRAVVAQTDSRSLPLFFFFLSTSFFFFFFLCRIDTRFLPTFIKNSLISSPLVATVSARDLPPHRYIRIGRQCFGRGRCEFEKAKPAPVAAVAASFLRQSKRSPIKARRAALSPLFSTATALSRCRRAIAVKSDR